MDAFKNPFSPGAGTPPPELAGRQQILTDAQILLGRVKRGQPEKNIFLTGLRGVGKTVLLNTITRMGRDTGYQIVAVEAHEENSLGLLLAPHLRELFYELARMAGVSTKVKRGLAVLRSFIGTLKISVGNVELGLDIEPLKGTSDSGNLSIDLPKLFQAVGEAVLDRKNAVGIFIDEMQYLNHRELEALIMAMHKVQQLQLPVVLVGTGLPTLSGLAGDLKSYAERLFNFPKIGALSPADSFKAIQEPALSEGVKVNANALTEIYRQTQGYPYFLQEWGYQAWNLAKRSPITLDVVQRASERVAERLDQSFFRVRFDRLTPSEKRFLRAMSDFDQEAVRTGDIAEKLRVAVGHLGPLRGALIKKSMIYSPSYGELAFTVPLFGDFMKRIMPKWG